MAFQIKISASEDVQKALAEIGRTEDIKFSPDNRRLAIAGLLKHKILILNVSIDESATGKQVTLSDCMTITSPSLKAPHGLFFIDDQTLIVADRGGETPILKLPQIGTGESSYELSALQTTRADQANLLKTPGSVAASRIGVDLYEILICNNRTHNVTRHILDAREEFRPIRNEVLLSKGLDIPDGIAVNEEWSWIAVSNHKTHNVLMYLNDPWLDRQSEPGGILRDATYPHGVRFTNDGNFVLVANGGAPYVHIYAKNGVDWKGERDPIASIRVMDEETFLRGRFNPQEGGPKGVDITNDMSVFVTTCAEQTLAFFDLEKILKEQELESSIPASDSADSSLAEISRDARISREVLVRELILLANTDARMALQKADLDAAHAKQIQSIYQARSWKITAALRWAYSSFRALQSKIRNKHPY